MAEKEIIAQLGFQVDTKELEKLKGALKNTSKMMGEFAAKAAKWAAGGIAAAGAAAAFLSVKTANLSKEIIASSNATKMSTDDWQAYTYAAEQSGTKAQDFQAMMEKLSETMTQAGDASSGQAKTYKELGISLKDANGNAKSSAQIFSELQAIYQSGDAAKQAKMNTLLGGVMEKNAGILSANADQMARLTKEGSKYALTKKQLDAGTSFNKNWDKFAAILTKIGGIILEVIEPAFTDLANQAGIVFDSLNISAQDISNWALDVEYYVLKAQTYFWEFVTFIKEWKDEILVILEIIAVAFAIKFAVDIVASVNTVVQSLGSVVTALKFVWNFALSLGPVFSAMWGGIVAGATWLWGVLTTIFTAISSVFLTIIAPLLVIGATIAAVAWYAMENWGYLKIFFNDIWDGMKAGAKSVADFFTTTFTSIKDTIIGSFKAALDYVTSAWNKIKGMASNIPGLGFLADSPAQGGASIPVPAGAAGATTNNKIESTTNVGKIEIQAAADPRATGLAVAAAIRKQGSAINQSAVGSLTTNFATG